jgi:outer membrane receptor protein involved in Fe transport
MRNICTTFFLFFIFLSQLSAQEIPVVTGVVKDEQGKYVQGATISLLKDSALVKVAISDQKGLYEFENIPSGNYQLTVSSVGFSMYISSLIQIEEGKSKALPPISLQPASTELSAIIVQARKPMIENRIDKLVVNVDASPTNAGSTALEVLEKSPGVTVDRDGNISLKGKQGIIVLMDGKQTYLSGPDLANLLRNMPASQLDQIEIMTQPSAKYDASGNSGIINLRTKKTVQKGLNGSVNLGYVQGRYPKSPNSFNFNYRKDRLNIFTSLSYSYWTNFNDQSLLRKFRGSNSQLTSVFDQSAFQTNTNKNMSARVGMDYSIDARTTIGFQVNGIYNPRDWENNGRADIFNGFGVLDSFNIASNKSQDKWRNYGSNFNFRKNFLKPGRELSADVDLIRYESRNQQRSQNLNYLPDNTLSSLPFLLNGDLPSDINIFSGKIDYVQPLDEDSKLEIGAKSSYVSTDNNARYTIYDHQDNKWFIDNTRSNHFIYKENINAAYASVNRKFNKWGVQAGLRVENTIARGDQLGNDLQKDTSFRKNYTQLFPTTFVSFAMNDNNQFGLSYGRRIERPNYQDMNPFQHFLDQYTFRQGNPNLNPQFTHNFELSHNYGGRLNTTLSYTSTTDILNDVLKQNDETKVTYQTKENVATRKTIGLAISYNTQFTKWWTSSIYMNVNNSHYEGFVNNRELDVSLTSLMANASQQFRFAKTWTAEVNGFFRTRAQETGLFLIEPMGVINFGIGKQILKNKGSLKLNINDPFYIQRAKVIIDFGNIDAVVNNQWDNRRVGLTFSYRFAKGQNVQQRKRGSSASEEQGRVGSGNN